MTRARRRALLAALVAFATGVAAEPGPGDGLVSAWKFDVYVDDKRVGTHLFEVLDTGAQRQVQSIADFRLKAFFFLPAYRYQHTNTERWLGDCLLEFSANTHVNGKRTRVSGEISDDGFTVQKNSASEVLPACVMSFAYWNPAFLKQQRLLNPQTGEFLEITVDDLGAGYRKVRGEKVAAERYKVTARGIDLVLWYSSDDKWLGLESVAKTGHVIRYELS